MLSKMREVIWEAFLEQNRSMTIFFNLSESCFFQNLFFLNIALGSKYCAPKIMSSGGPCWVFFKYELSYNVSK